MNLSSRIDDDVLWHVQVMENFDVASDFCLNREKHALILEVNHEMHAAVDVNHEICALIEEANLEMHDDVEVNHGIHVLIEEANLEMYGAVGVANHEIHAGVEENLVTVASVEEVKENRDDVDDDDLVQDSVTAFFDSHDHHHGEADVRVLVIVCALMLMTRKLYAYPNHVYVLLIFLQKWCLVVLKLQKI